MRALRQSLLCLVVLFALCLFSSIAGLVLEIMGSLFDSLAHYWLNDRPLPAVTRWIRALYFKDGLALLTICFFPTLTLAAYLWRLIRTIPDPIERHTKFALAALATFIGITGFLIFGVFSLASPFLYALEPVGMSSAEPPPTPPLQTGIFVSLIILVLLNAVYLVRMFISQRRVIRGNVAV